MFKIANEGSLALKYELDAKADADAVTDLAPYIDVYVKTGETEITERPADFTEFTSGERIGTLADVLGNATLLTGELNKTDGKTDYAAIALHMPENTSNDAQGKALGTFSIVLNAKQAAYEKDGFGNPEYDKDAEYLIRQQVSTVEDLKEALKNPDVAMDITVPQKLENVKNLEVKGTVTLNLGTSMLKNSTGIVGSAIQVTDGGNLSINAEANPSEFDYTAGQLKAAGAESKLTVNGGRYGNSGANKAEVEASENSTVILTDGVFTTSGYRGHAVAAQSGAIVTITGGRYGCSGAESVAMYADGGTIILEDCQFSSVNGNRYGAVNGGKIMIARNVSPDKPTSIISGCTVTEDGNYWIITGN